MKKIEKERDDKKDKEKQSKTEKIKNGIKL